MTCSEVRNALPEYAGKKVTAGEREIIERHLSTCPACREELNALDRLTDNLRRIAPSVPSPAYWSGLLPRIREHLDNDRRPGFTGRLIQILAPVAAVVVLIVVLFRVFLPEGTPRNENLAGIISGLQSEELLRFEQEQMLITADMYAGSRTDGNTDLVDLRELLQDEESIFTGGNLDPVEFLAILNTDETNDLFSRFHNGEENRP